MSGSHAAGTKIRNQQLVTAKNIQRQKTIAVVEAVEVALLLVAVSRIVGGVVVQNDLIGWHVIAVQKRIHNNFVQLENGLRIDSIFEPRMS